MEYRSHGSNRVSSIDLHTEEFLTPVISITKEQIDKAPNQNQIPYCKVKPLFDGTTMMMTEGTRSTNPMEVIKSQV
jgi:hypothetical protein